MAKSTWRRVNQGPGLLVTSRVAAIHALLGEGEGEGNKEGHQLCQPQGSWLPTEPQTHLNPSRQSDQETQEWVSPLAPAMLRRGEQLIPTQHTPHTRRATISPLQTPPPTHTHSPRLPGPIYCTECVLCVDLKRTEREKRRWWRLGKKTGPTFSLGITL